jgi:hypothetical protein
MGGGADQLFGIKDGLVLHHEEGGAGDLDGENGVGLEFIAAAAQFQELGQGLDGLDAFGDDGHLAPGPAQIGVAQLGAAQALDLAGAGDRAFDQAAIGEEVFHGREAVDVADFVEDEGGEVFADAGHGLEEGEIAAGEAFGVLAQLGFDGDDLGVVMADESQFVLEGELADGIGFLGQEGSFPGIAVGAGRFVGGTVVGQLDGLDAGEQIGAMPDEVSALAQQRPEGTFGGGIDVSLGNQVGTEEVGDLFGVNAVVLVLAAMNGLEIEGMSQDEGEVGGLAGVGEPVPAEHALGADGQVVAVRGDELEEEGEVIVANVRVDQDFSLAIHEADVHLVGVEINSAVVFGGGGIILHSVRRKVPRGTG